MNSYTSESVSPNTERKLPAEFKFPHEASLAFFAALERVGNVENAFIDQPDDFEKARMVGMGNRAADFFYGNGPFDSEQIMVWNDETGKKRIDELSRPVYLENLGAMKEMRQTLLLPAKPGKEDLYNRIVAKGKRAEEILFGAQVKKIIFE